MPDAISEETNQALLKTLPGDDVRQIMWRFADRYDLQMLVQSSRSVARSVVARLVADGERNNHDWTEKKQELFSAFDASGITSAFMDTSQGGFIDGPKNLALSLVAFELSWVDAGAATSSLASNLALAPIHERGTPEQRDKYMRACVPPQPGESRKIARGAFVLTEPLPFVGVDTGVMSGKMRVAEFEEGREPVLQVDKRGRFITGMAVADFVTAAVDSDDPRIKGSCMVILEKTDPGIFDRGAATLKMVHQLSSTCDPIFSLKVPAGRIIGGYDIKDGVLIPKYSHSEVIEAVFRRTRVAVGLMSSAKLLSAVEPIIRYQRQRFRGGEASAPGSPRYELGIQQREDALHRLADVWAMGEAASSLGFATARCFDEFDPVDKAKDKMFTQKGIKGRAQLKIFKGAQKLAEEYVELSNQPEDRRDKARFEELGKDTVVRFMAGDAVANVLCPACKLWNTGNGVNAMREAVSLMGGYGITEDCPGFLPQKWMDAQLEATYEGPEAVQRRQLSVTMAQDLFLKQFTLWSARMRRMDGEYPRTGAGTLAAGMELWLWAMDYLSQNTDAAGKPLYHGQRQGAVFPMADALCWLLASYHQILDTVELADKGALNPALSEGLPGYVKFFSDLCCIQAAKAAGEVAKITSELVYGYQERSKPLEEYEKLRTKIGTAMAGSRLAKDDAAEALTKVMIPEALDYPA